MRKRARRVVHLDEEYSFCARRASERIQHEGREPYLVKDAGCVRREGEESHSAIELVHLRRAPSRPGFERCGWREVLLNVIYRGGKRSCAAQLDVRLEVDRELERGLRRRSSAPRSQPTAKEANVPSSCATPSGSPRPK